jgi:YidC/Oxa1 family membrane protein insertase
MDNRVILFLILALAIILGYDYLLKQMGVIPPPQPEEQPATEPGRGATGTSEPTTISPSSKMAPNQPGPARGRGEASPIPSDTNVAIPSDELEVEVQTELYRAVFTNRGGAIKSWELKRYMTSQDRPHPIQLMYTGGAFRKPLTLQTDDSALSTRFSEGLYRIERDFTTLDAAHPQGLLTFTSQDPRTGIRVIKQLTFRHDSYIVDVAIKTEGITGNIGVTLGTNFGIVEWGEGFIGLIGPATLVEGKIEKDTPETELERKGAVGWVALQDKYFLSVLIPTEASAAVVKKEGDKLVSAGVRFPAPAQGSGHASFQFYAGPKEFNTLKSMNVGLEDTIDFGWFIYGSWSIVKAVAKPLFYVLRSIYDFTHNYGVAIILLTIGIKLLFVPLQYKSYKSMKDMQQVQPKVVALQAKYKDDRERLNRELIKLYRDHKVNPVGGCLPMLLQMPAFVALFNILYMTIDLRQAPFVLWITDLSVQDPYYVLPVIMGASMVVQQKIMPTTMDPTQAKIMLLLPGFMTLLFLTFPSGLVLYWLTNNVITISQQFITDRYIFKKPTFASAPSTADEPRANTVAGDGEKPGSKKNKDKVANKAEANTQVES